MEKLFPLGRVGATKKSLAALEASNEEPFPFFERHVTGDWGGVSNREKAANMLALTTGRSVRSTFRTLLGVEFWIVTGPDRSVTFMLLPEERTQAPTPVAIERKWI
jgi:hypothetical protein